jgi:hypothetical protein
MSVGGAGSSDEGICLPAWELWRPVFPLKLNGKPEFGPGKGGQGYFEVADSNATRRSGEFSDVVENAGGGHYCCVDLGFKCIKLCSSDASCFVLVASHWFISIVGPVFWSLRHDFLLPGGLRMASRIS